METKVQNTSFSQMTIGEIDSAGDKKREEPLTYEHDKGSSHPPNLRVASPLSN